MPSGTSETSTLNANLDQFLSNKNGPNGLKFWLKNDSGPSFRYYTRFFDVMTLYNPKYPHNLH